MRIIVTGSSGLLGRHVCHEMVARGHDVFGVDRVPAASVPWQQAAADLMDLGVALQLIRHCDAVVHLASLPRPLGLADAEVFRTNVALNYNVTEAAALGGVPRLIYASSVSVLGNPFGPRLIPTRYLPIDADHPPAPQESYGLSKWLGEEIVDAAVRRGAFDAVSLRLPWVQTPQSFFAQVAPRRVTEAAALDLWAYIDARDAASAFGQAVQWDGKGHLRVYATARDSYSEDRSADLVAKAFPHAEIRRALNGYESVIDNALARMSLGFVAQHSWRDYRPEKPGGQHEAI